MPRSLAALVVLLVLGTLSPALAAGEEPRVTASTYRVDLGQVIPGETRSGEFTLSNPGYQPVTVRLVPEGDPVFVEAPGEVVLPPGASVPVRYAAHVAPDAPPGFHGEALRLVPRAVLAQPGVGTLDAGTAIVFTWRTTAVGVSAIQAPALAVPGQNVTGAVTVVNTWSQPVDATVRLEWRDPTGAIVRTTDLGPVLVERDAAARLPFELPPGEARAGVQTLAATIVEAGNAPVGGGAEQTFPLGRREATILLAGVQDLRDGNASVSVDLENTGDVPITLVPRVRVRAADGTVREIELPAVTLAPGEKRRVEGMIALPPGTFQLEADAEGATQAILPAGERAPTGTFVMAAPEGSGPPLLAVLSIWFLVAAALVALAALAWRLRRAPRAPRAARSVPVAAGPTDDAFDALFAKLAADEPAPRASTRNALFVDVDSLPPGLGLFELARGRSVEVAYAYARARSPAGAQDLHEALARLGFTPRVLQGAEDFRIEIALDASREARQGRSVILATGDAAFARLVAALEAEGATVEVLPLGRRVPVQGEASATSEAASFRPQRS